MVRLAGFQVYRYSLPLIAPLALGDTVLRRREGVLLKLVGDGEDEGWGEAAPLPGFSREGVRQAAEELHGAVSPLVDHEVVEEWTAPGTPLSGGLEVRWLWPSSRFAFELAVLNLLARSGGTSPGLLLPARTTVPISVLLSGPRERVLGDARRLRGAGYTTFKLKVGSRGGHGERNAAGDAARDAALVREVSEALGDGATLRLDANRAWDLRQATEFARGVADISGIEYVEEPLSDPALLPGFAEETGLTLALDESLVGMEPEDLREHRYARAVVLKPTLIGGVRRALRFAREASRLGMAPVVSAAYETGIGTAALVALAAGIGDGTTPAGLDTYRRLAEDVVSPPLDLSNPEVNVRAALARRGIVGRHLTPVEYSRKGRP